MEKKKYVTYEEPFAGQTFSIEGMKKIYSDMVDKTEYHDFDSWLFDMVKSGVFEEVK